MNTTQLKSLVNSVNPDAPGMADYVTKMNLAISSIESGLQITTKAKKLGTKSKRKVTGRVVELSESTLAVETSKGVFHGWVRDVVVD